MRNPAVGDTGPCRGAGGSGTCVRGGDVGSCVAAATSCEKLTAPSGATESAAAASDRGSSHAVRGVVLNIDLGEAPGVRDLGVPPGVEDLAGPRLPVAAAAAADATSGERPSESADRGVTGIGVNPSVLASGPEGGGAGDQPEDGGAGISSCPFLGVNGKRRKSATEAAEFLADRPGVLGDAPRFEMLPPDTGLAVEMLPPDTGRAG